MFAFVKEAFLTPEECWNIRHSFPGLTTAQINSSRTDLRRSATAFLQDEKLFTKVKTELARVNHNHYHFDINGTEALQLAQYAPGDSYGWHLDIGPGEARKRKLSASIQLSSPIDYDGGDLELWNTPGKERGQGTLIVFPSYLAHRVAPVTRGIRYSLVAWATGELPYR